MAIVTTTTTWTYPGITAEVTMDDTTFAIQSITVTNTSDHAVTLWFQWKKTKATTTILAGQTTTWSIPSNWRNINWLSDDISYGVG
jgi:hypothetical protein